MNSTRNKKIALILGLAVVFGFFAYLGNRPGTYTSVEECLQYANIDQSCSKKMFAWVIVDNPTFTEK